MSAAVLIMARAPRPGTCKTRLEPLLGAAGCARLQAELIRHTAGWIADSGRPAWLAVDPPDAALADLVPAAVRRFPQHGNDLGERLQAAVARVTSTHAGPVIVVGTDSPTLGPRDVDALERALDDGYDAALLAAHDGGYAALALSRPLPRAFDLPEGAWGGPDVLELTVALLRRQGAEVRVLGPIHDLDTPDDARRLAADPACPEAVRTALAAVSIVVPVLDEERALPALLDHLAQLPGHWEMIVVDGGSRDRTVALAETHPLRPIVVRSPPGRARQMNAGADRATGDVLLFLHADTVLPADAHAQLTAALADPRVQGGNFRVLFGGGGGFARLLTGVYAVQRRLGIYYGDSAIWLRRAAFARLDGYRELEIMEDHDLARRLERSGATRCLPGPAITSPRRWQRLGLARTVASWTVIRWLYHVGVPPARLAALYPPAR